MSKFNAAKASVLALTAVFAVAAFLLGKSITNVSACTNKGWVPTSDWSQCVSKEPQCGTSNGTQSRTLTCQTVSGADSNCSLGTVDVEGHYINPDTKSEPKDCTLSEPDYSSCDQAEQCPTACGHEASRIPDGEGGYISCEATQACETPAPVPTPLNCTGDQHPDGGGVNCVSFSQAGPPPQGPYTPPQGQVLGASTMAGTGSFAENLYIAIMGVGGIIAVLGIKNLKFR